MTNHNQWLFRQQLSVVTLTKILLDPFVAVLVLIGCTLYFGEPFRGPYPPEFDSSLPKNAFSAHRP